MRLDEGCLFFCLPFPQHESIQKKVLDALKTVCYMRKRFSAFLLGCLMCCFRGVVESDEVRCCFASLFFSRSLLIHSGPWESGSWDFLTYSSSEREVLSALDKDFFFRGMLESCCCCSEREIRLHWWYARRKNYFCGILLKFFEWLALEKLRSHFNNDPWSRLQKKKKSFGNWNPLKFIVDGWWLVKLWSIVGAGICSGVEVFRFSENCWFGKFREWRKTKFNEFSVFEMF